MKKSVILLLFIFLLLGLVSAFNIDLKNNYSPGQTIIFSIEGNFLTPLSSESIYFYSGRVQIPLIFDIAKIGEKYYVYAENPVIERNYTLTIKDAHYYENGQEYTQDLSKNFTVSGKMADFSVSPGFIVTKDNFEISLESFNSTLNVSSTLLGETQNTKVLIGQKNHVSFSVQNINNLTIASIKISALKTSYEIPIVIIPNSSTPYYNDTNVSKGELKFSQSSYDFYVNQGVEKTFKVKITNRGNSDISNINFSLSPSLRDFITIDPSKLPKIAKNESITLNLKVKTDDSGNFTGELKATTSNFSIESSLLIASYAENQIIPVENVSCLSLAGDICLEGYSCEGNSTKTDDVMCCLGYCAKNSSPSSWYKWAAFILLLVALGVMGFFYWKSKKPKKITPEALMNKTKKEFETRMSPSSEVTGRITKS